MITALAALALPFAANCKKSESKMDDSLQPAVVTEPGTTAPAGHGAPAGHAPAQNNARGKKAAEGEVMETMNAGGYTYVLVKTGSEEIWAAAPEVSVKVSDKVSFQDGMPMTDFPSPSLKRTFKLVYFVPALVINGAAAAPVARVGGAPGGAATFEVEVKGIKKVEGGKTVGELFASKATMGGKPVKVRGIVVKYNAGIMGSNWLHIKDGSGEKGADDLTVTTQATANVGDKVVIEGTVGIEKDFGAGYKYGLIVEDAKVTVE